MEIPNTPENRVLANAVNARIKADARILNAKAAFWRLAGWALVCAMIGVGTGAALFGWTYSRLSVASSPSVPLPTDAKLGQEQRPTSQTGINAAFTVFKTVSFGNGNVVTGWNFDSSEQKVPGHQYCYYSEEIDGGAKLTVALGENGQRNPKARPRGGMDPEVAWSNCVWFKTGAT